MHKFSAKRIAVMLMLSIYVSLAVSTAAYSRDDIYISRKIERVQLYTETIKSVTKKEKGNPVGGAAVGWLLFGPLGALFGAASSSHVDKEVNVTEVVVGCGIVVKVDEKTNVLFDIKKDSRGVPSCKNLVRGDNMNIIRWNSRELTLVLPGGYNYDGFVLSPKR